MMERETTLTNEDTQERKKQTNKQKERNKRSARILVSSSLSPLLKQSRIPCLENEDIHQ